MRTLVTGASGFAGAALIPRLLQDGHRLRALARDRERLVRALAAADQRPDVELATGDILTGEGLPEALKDMDVAYYLIHSMETAAGDPFPERERRAAENFAREARAAGVRRIVYLGGPLPRVPRASPHLASRHEVERILMEAVPGSVTLRASIVVGARSRSFRFLVRLVERLPVIALPAWRRYRTQPIDERDIVELLARAATSKHAAGRTLQAGGPDVLTYREIVERIAELMMVGRPTLGVNLNATPLTARVAAALAGEDPELVLPLMESLECDLLVGDRRQDAAQLLEVPLHSFDAAVEHALAEWEKTQPLAAR